MPKPDLLIWRAFPFIWKTANCSSTHSLHYLLWLLRKTHSFNYIEGFLLTKLWPKICCFFLLLLLILMDPGKYQSHSSSWPGLEMCWWLSSLIVWWGMVPLVASEIWPLLSSFLSGWVGLKRFCISFPAWHSRAFVNWSSAFNSVNLDETWIITFCFSSAFLKEYVWWWRSGLIINTGTTLGARSSGSMMKLHPFEKYLSNPLCQMFIKH